VRRRLMVGWLALAGVAIAGCTRSLSTAQAAAIQDSVRIALADFSRLSAAAQWDSVVHMYSEDSSFRWIEEGTRYRVAEMRQGMERLPAGMRFETTYDSTLVVALAPGFASLTTYYRTRFVGSTASGQFAGAMSMIWAHEAGGWRIREGHSSTGARTSAR
jgi:hypothetical protein